MDDDDDDDDYIQEIFHKINFLSACKFAAHL